MVSSAYERMMENPTANIARLPDEYAGRTSLLKLKQSFDITTNADGNWGIVVNPGGLDVAYRTYNFTAGTTNYASSTPVAHADQTATSSAIKQMRFISGSAEISYSGEDQLSSGTLTLWNGLACDSDTVAADLSTLRDNHGAEVVTCSSLKMKKAHVRIVPYDRPTFAGVTAAQSGMPSVFFVILGAPASTNVGNITFCLNYECIPLPDIIGHDVRDSPVNPIHHDGVHRRLQQDRGSMVHMNAFRKLPGDDKKKKKKKKAPVRRYVRTQWLPRASAWNRGTRYTQRSGPRFGTDHFYDRPMKRTRYGGRR
jgi:hypothetical protein